MQQLKYEVQFVTPAFLGDANQDACWRTPPFKALLRQWWRVVWAAKNGNDPSNIEQMRREEGLLFGHAWLKDDQNARGKKVAARQSRVRLRLDRWDRGKLGKSAWSSKEARTEKKIEHPEVKSPRRIGSLLYLGFGPLKVENGSTALKESAAIQENEKALLTLALPEENYADIRATIELISAYGAIGGRSRNGWGSMHLYPEGADSFGGNGVCLKQYQRPWEQALEAEFPDAIGSDDQGALVWITKQSYTDWNSVMSELAKLKIALRTEFKFHGNHHKHPEDRHWLAYPVTRHPVDNWKRENLRLPNSLRFKVRRDEKSGKLQGVAFHMPCLPPSDFSPNRGKIKQVWQRVHEYLDKGTDLLKRTPE